MTLEGFSPFDPLKVKAGSDDSLAATRARKREIENILSSYVGWYDPFGELIQNALDAIDKRREEEKAQGTNSSYQGEVRVIIDLDQNLLTVSDNGIGMTSEQFQKFLAPNFSFKEVRTSRGHKGVGATYLAYGFNSLRVYTMTPGHRARGRILNARNWTIGELDLEPPLVEPDLGEVIDAEFEKYSRGTSLTLRFDETTTPGKLSWMGAKSAETWSTLLRIKTGLGALQPLDNLRCTIFCISSGVETRYDLDSPSYLWLNEQGQNKTATLRDLEEAREKAFRKNGNLKAVPNKFRQLVFLKDIWHGEEVSGLLSDEERAEHEMVIQRHTPTIMMEYGYTTRLWKSFNASLGIRSNQEAVRAGIQLAANRMPQGDPIQVPLTRYIGRQNQVHFLIHFDNYTPDLGRKGFAKPLVDFAKDVSRAIVQFRVTRVRDAMKRDSGATPDLAREMALDQWKEEMLEHESSSPLTLENEHFFAPRRKISITSEPTREQDVIALFHELVSGGVIRGLEILSTNERFTYDGLFRIDFSADRDLYEYAEISNPLGVSHDVLDEMHGKRTKPKVLEYKYSLDGLVADIQNQDKNMNDIDLCVCWSVGDEWAQHYSITTLLTPENVHQRQYHGATHVLQDPDSRARLCDLIMLKDLIGLLQNREAEYQRQRDTYE